jgi:hypothetical protein
MAMRRSSIILSLCSLCLMLLILYMGLDTKGSFHFQEHPRFMHYGMLADAFVSGQIHLKQPVDPDRLKSRDPLDPSTPYPFMFDAIIYNGKYYFQHEPLPGLMRAILLYITGFSPPTGAIVVTFALGVFILMGVLLWRMRQLYFRESPAWMFWYIWLSFALSGIQLYIASRPVIYHESAAEGCFFVLAGTLLLVHGLTVARHRLITACLSGIGFAAAIACRALLVIYPVCLVLTFLAFAAIRRQSIGATILWALSFGSPVLLSVSGLLGYNYARFGDCLDFGRSHVIFPQYSAYLYLSLEGHFFSWKHVPYQLYYYLLSLPWIVAKFPYLRYPFGESWANGVYLIRELVCSVFIAMPVLVLAIPFPIILRQDGARDRRSLILVFCGVSSLAVLALLSAFIGAAARYFYDFTPLLFVLAFCNLAAFWNGITVNPRRKTMAKVALAILFIGNVLMGLLLGLTGTKQ